jgi:ABC-type dipeptide/oligopeptide/nickel transport system ATPase component
MYAGRIVEQGPTDAVLHDPQHAYTRLLLSAVPNPDGGLQLEPFVKARRPAVDGELVEVRPAHFVRQPTT